MSVNTVTFRAPSTFYFLLFCLSAFITGAPLVTNQILPLTIHWWPTIYCVDYCFILTVLLEEVLPIADLHLGSHWIQLALVHSTFSPILSCILCTASTNVHFNPLLIFKTLRDPNGSPLQVINLTNESTMAYTTSTGYVFDTVQAIGSAWQPHCLTCTTPSVVSRHQQHPGDLLQPGDNPTGTLLNS